MESFTDKELPLHRGPDNIMDKYIVNVLSKGLLCCWTYVKASLSKFLVRSYNKRIVEVTGSKINWQAGYRLKVPCVFCFYGPFNYLYR